MGKESPAAREAEARRRAMARKKAIDYQTRAMRLHLGAPKLPRGRQNVDIQTDVHLEEVRIVKLYLNVCFYTKSSNCGKKLKFVKFCIVYNQQFRLKMRPYSISFYCTVVV